MRYRKTSLIYTNVFPFSVMVVQMLQNRATFRGNAFWIRLLLQTLIFQKRNTLGRFINYIYIYIYGFAKIRGFGFGFSVCKLRCSLMFSSKKKIFFRFFLCSVLSYVALDLIFSFHLRFCFVLALEMVRFRFLLHLIFANPIYSN